MRKAAKDEDLEYLKALRSQIVKRTRRRAPAFPFERERMEELAQRRPSKDVYEEALVIWRELAQLSNQVHADVLAGNAISRNHLSYTELLWYFAPIVLHPDHVSKEIAEEVVGQPISWHTNGRKFDEALGDFFRAENIPGLDYERLWQSNMEAVSYVAFEWAKNRNWPRHRPLRWIKAALYIDGNSHSDLNYIFQKRSSAEIDEMLKDIDPQEEPPRSLKGALSKIGVEQWKGLNKDTLGKLLKMDDPEIRLLAIRHGVGGRAAAR